jgi:BASS family bile acid:Na+ symporter
MTAADVIMLAIRISIVLTVLAVGLGATTADAVYLFRRPMLLGRALLSMHGIMLAVGIAFAALLDLHPAVEIALLALALSPVPPLFPGKVVRAGEAQRYAVSLMAALAALSIVVVPVGLSVVGRAFDVPLVASAMVVAQIVLTTVLVPLIVGIVVRSVAPSFAERLAKVLAPAGTVLLVVAALPILATQAPLMLSLVGNGTLAAFATFAVVGLAAGHLVGAANEHEQVVLALSTSTRHPAVAIAIAHANFPEQAQILTAVLLFLLVSGVVGVIYVGWVKRRRPQLA